MILSRHKATILCCAVVIFVVSGLLFFSFILGHSQLLMYQIPELTSALIRATLYVVLFVIVHFKVPDPEGVPFYRNRIKMRFLFGLLIFELFVVHELLLSVVRAFI